VPSSFSVTPNKSSRASIFSNSLKEVTLPLSSKTGFKAVKISLI
jgi:hypothetical protein